MCASIVRENDSSGGLLRREQGFIHHLICRRPATKGIAEVISIELFQQNCVWRRRPSL
jgi:hypothetical protein